MKKTQQILNYLLRFILLTTFLAVSNSTHAEEQESNTEVTQSSEFSVPADKEERKKLWDSLSEEKKEELRKKYSRFKKLNPEQRKQLKSKMQKWKNLPPEERTRLKKRWKNFQKLPPEERTRIQAKIQEFKKLPQEERQKRKSDFRKWRKNRKTKSKQE